MERRIIVADVVAFFFSLKISQEKNLFFTPPPKEVFKEWVLHFNPEIVNKADPEHIIEIENSIKATMEIDFDDITAKSNFDMHYENLITNYLWVLSRILLRICWL